MSSATSYPIITEVRLPFDRCSRMTFGDSYLGDQTQLESIPFQLPEVNVIFRELDLAVKDGSCATKRRARHGAQRAVC